MAHFQPISSHENSTGPSRFIRARADLQRLLLGLVNTGTTPQTDHQDHAHGAHCTQTSCLMYYQVDTSNFLANLLGGTVPSLDAACVQDLKANGGK